MWYVSPSTLTTDQWTDVQIGLTSQTLKYLGKKSSLHTSVAPAGWIWQSPTVSSGDPSEPWGNQLDTMSQFLPVRGVGAKFFWNLFSLTSALTRLTGRKRDTVSVWFPPRPKLSVASVYWTYTDSVHWVHWWHTGHTLGLHWLHYSVCTVYTAVYAQCIH